MVDICKILTRTSNLNLTDFPHERAREISPAGIGMIGNSLFFSGITFAAALRYAPIILVAGAVLLVGAHSLPKRKVSKG